MALALPAPLATLQALHGRRLGDLANNVSAALSWISDNIGAVSGVVGLGSLSSTIGRITAMAVVSATAPIRRRRAR